MAMATEDMQTAAQPTGTATASTAAEAWIMVRIIPPTAHEMTAPALLLGRIWRTPGMT